MGLQRNDTHSLPLSDLLGIHLDRDPQVGGLQLDSRLLQTGDLFLAISGEQQDGRNYIAEAVAAGAVAIVADKGLSALQRTAAASLPLLEVDELAQKASDYASRFYAEPSADMYLAGITGTNGKTTTSRLAAQLLRRQFGQCGVMGTLGSVLDDSVDEVLNTTPDAVSLQRQLAEWRSMGVGHVTLEVSSHSLVQGRVAATRFDTAVFTNLSHDHLDYHGDMPRYAAAKAQLFAFESLKSAVINLDDDYAVELQKQLAPSVDLVRYSLANEQAELVASHIRHAGDGIHAHLRSPWGRGELHSPLPADFNLSNVLAAIAIVCSAGAAFADVLEHVPQLRGVPGRMEYVANSLQLQLVVDYAHTPDALLQALSALRPHTTGQLICVFGCGGDRDAEKRPLMGRVATEHADRVIVTSDNPRSENPDAIIEDVLAGCEFDVEVDADRAGAIRRAVSTARPGDCVLIAGKGHETYQQVGTDRFPFSDVQHLRLAAIEGVQS